MKQLIVFFQKMNQTYQFIIAMFDHLVLAWVVS